MENSKFELRDADGKGRGLFALINFSKGDIIFEEDPVVSCQFAWNEDYGYEACHHCLRPLETAEENARRLTMKWDLNIKYSEQCTVDKVRQVTCPSCSVKYCSTECQILSWDSYHKTLCINNLGSDYINPLKQLKQTWKEMHYPPETTTIMLFVRILAMIHQAEDKEAIANTFEHFCHSTTFDEGASYNAVGLKYSDHLDLLRDQLLECGMGEWAPEWTSPDGFRALVALVGRNGQGIGTSSFSDWVRNVKSLDIDEKELESFDIYVEKLYDEFDNAVGPYLNNEGSGLYSTQSCINHSCRPNAEVAFTNSNHRLAVRCIEDIPAGDEITISYLEDCALRRSRFGRQKTLLTNYFFKCKCQRCHDEMDQPDETSDEEEPEGEEEEEESVDEHEPEH